MKHLFAIAALAIPSAASATTYVGTVASVTFSGYEYDTDTGLLAYSYSRTYRDGEAFTINAGPNGFRSTVGGSSQYDYSPAPLTDISRDGSFNDGNWHNFDAALSAAGTGKTYLRGYVTISSGYDGGADSVTYDLSGPGVVTGDRPSVTTSAVPEPETWAMMIVGMGLMGAVLRRREVIA